eukprot:TRINITY_DN340_c0_g1_i2.p1 TRINITY_DN340_c0_g1~~TRINITY_DN340_c0_g1_i2.p1  ORF type:complete len:278 (+),score=52.82 TRINITY_DN340_c0_g1_i2:45-878(+)
MRRIGRALRVVRLARTTRVVLRGQNFNSRRAFGRNVDRFHSRRFSRYGMPLFIGSTIMFCALPPYIRADHASEKKKKEPLYFEKECQPFRTYSRKVRETSEKGINVATEFAEKIRESFESAVASISGKYEASPVKDVVEYSKDHLPVPFVVLGTLYLTFKLFRRYGTKSAAVTFLSGALATFHFHDPNFFLSLYKGVASKWRNEADNLEQDEVEVEILAEAQQGEENEAEEKGAAEESQVEEKQEVAEEQEEQQEGKEQEEKEQEEQEQEKEEKVQQ